MKTIILILAIGLIFAQNINNGETLMSEFQKFMKQYKVGYSTPDDFNRLFTVYQENFRLVNSNRNAGYALELNKYALLTKAEFRNTYLTLDADDLKTKLQTVPVLQANSGPVLTAPSTYDWRNQGAVTGVKDQGNCGCCWAFSTVAIVEGAYYVKYKRSPAQYSEQQLVNCDNTNNACNGGNMVDGLNYIKRAGGLARMSTFPYRASKQACTFKSSQGVIRVAGLNQINGSESSIKDALVRYGPLGAAVDSTNLQFYSSGIYTCNGGVNVNHAITIVGYGVDKSGLYWIIKNSWGTSWGMNGYFYLRSGHCGINEYIVAGTVA